MPTIYLSKEHYDDNDVHIVYVEGMNPDHFIVDHENGNAKLFGQTQPKPFYHVTSSDIHIDEDSLDFVRMPNDNSTFLWPEQNDGSITITIDNLSVDSSAFIDIVDHITNKTKQSGNI